MVKFYSGVNTWRKLHVSVDEASEEIVAAALSTDNWKDGQLLGDLLKQTPDTIHQLSADGAYDSWKNDRLLQEKKSV